MTDLQLTLEETISELSRLVEHLDVMTRFAAEDEIENLESAVELLVALNSVKSRLGVSYSSYEQTIATGMEDDYMLHLPGNIEVTRREGAPRKKWDHQKLGKAVVERLVDQSIDFDTGEILKSTEEIAMGLLQYAAPSYWRVKELKKIGLDAGKYSELGDPKVTVSIKRTQG